MEIEHGMLVNPNKKSRPGSRDEAKTMRTSHRIRRGTSLMEVIAGMTLMALLMVPTVGLLTASTRIWRQFETGHGSVAVRQATIQDISQRLEGATRVLSVSGAQLRFRGMAGDNQRLYQRGNQVLWQHAGRNDLIGEGVGALRFRQIQRGPSALQGELIEVRLDNVAGSNIANTQSTCLVWVKPVI
jgi:hypothetical protein